mgnify:CR=1 FL=1
MSKSAIYTTNVSNPTVAAGGIVPVGTTARRYGCNVRQDGNAIVLCGQGYYLVDVSATVAPSAAGNVSLTAQTVAANSVANLKLTAIVRNACGCESSLLSLLLGGVASVINNLAVTVEKL